MDGIQIETSKWLKIQTLGHMDGIKGKFCQQVQDSGEDFPKLIATSSNQNNHRRENLLDFEQSDDEGYDNEALLSGVVW